MQIALAIVQMAAADTAGAATTKPPRPAPA